MIVLLCSAVLDVSHAVLNIRPASSATEKARLHVLVWKGLLFIGALPCLDASWGPFGTSGLPLGAI
eukprot:2848213-Pyramimonas_sp.AAC.1